jgi:hypothetical protein
MALSRSELEAALVIAQERIRAAETRVMDALGERDDALKALGRLALVNDELVMENEAMHDSLHELSDELMARDLAMKETSN